MSLKLARRFVVIHVRGCETAIITRKTRKFSIIAHGVSLRVKGHRKTDKPSNNIVFLYGKLLRVLTSFISRTLRCFADEWVRVYRREQHSKGARRRFFFFPIRKIEKPTNVIVTRKSFWQIQPNGFLERKKRVLLSNLTYNSNESSGDRLMVLFTFFLVSRL